MLILSRGIAFLLFSLLFFPVQAIGSSDVIINEIAWMGTEKSSNDEWIELYNGSDSSISLDGWMLKSLTGTLKINLKGLIPSKGFYLLERSDDDTLPGIQADLIYTGALKNTGEIIELYNNLVNPIDSVNCSSSWLAGNNETKQTMERIGPEEWQTSKDPGGTPGETNGTTTRAQISEPEKKEYSSGVIINEILPSPDGPDGEKEWIEILNQNDFEVNLSGWKISDTAGTIKTYVFPEGSMVFPKEFLVLYRPTANIILNNDGDGLILISPDGKTADSVDFGKVKTGESYNRIGSSWLWGASSTPGAINQIFLSKENSPKEKQADIQNKEPTTSDKTLAAISEPIKEIKNKREYKFLPASLIALTISLFSGIVILLLKKKIKQTN